MKRMEKKFWLFFLFWLRLHAAKVQTFSDMGEKDFCMWIILCIFAPWKQSEYGIIDIHRQHIHGTFLSLAPGQKSRWLPALRREDPRKRADDGGRVFWRGLATLPWEILKATGLEFPAGRGSTSRTWPTFCSRWWVSRAHVGISIWWLPKCSRSRCMPTCTGRARWPTFGNTIPRPAEWWATTAAGVSYFTSKMIWSLSTVSARPRW